MQSSINKIISEFGLQTIPLPREDSALYIGEHHVLKVSNSQKNSRDREGRHRFNQDFSRFFVSESPLQSEHDFSLFRRIVGEKASYEDSFTSITVKKFFFTVIDKIKHDTEIDTQHLNDLVEGVPDAVRNNVSEICAELKTFKYGSTPCHGDLSINNMLVKDGRIYLLDFEYYREHGDLCRDIIQFYGRAVIQSIHQENPLNILNDLRDIYSALSTEQRRRCDLYLSRKMYLAYYTSLDPHLGAVGDYLKEGAVTIETIFDALFSKKTDIETTSTCNFLSQYNCKENLRKYFLPFSINTTRFFYELTAHHCSREFVEECELLLSRSDILHHEPIFNLIEKRIHLDYRPYFGSDYYKFLLCSICAAMGANFYLENKIYAPLDKVLSMSINDNIGYILDSLCLPSTTYFDRDDFSSLVLSRKEFQDGLKNKRILFIGCSTGAEVISFLSTADKLDFALDNINLKAIDANPLAIKTAKNADYPNMDEHIQINVERYLPYIQYEVASILNFLSDEQEVYDLIVCRNVIKYFSPDAQKIAAKKILFALKNGGILVTGKYDDGKDNDFDFSRIQGFISLEKFIFKKAS